MASELAAGGAFVYMTARQAVAADEAVGTATSLARRIVNVVGLSAGFVVPLQLAADHCERARYPRPAVRPAAGGVSCAFLDLEDRVGDEPVRLTVHGVRGLGVRRFDEAEICPLPSSTQ